MLATLTDLRALFPEFWGVRVNPFSWWLGFAAGALFMLACELAGRALAGYLRARKRRRA